MENVMQKEESKLTDEAKKPDSQDLKATAGFSGLLSKHPSMFDIIGKVISHPFVTIGGILVVVFVLYKAWRSGIFNSTQAKLNGIEGDLIHQIKALKKENKKLRQQLALLSADGSNHLRNETKQLTTKRKVSTVYLD